MTNMNYRRDKKVVLTVYFLFYYSILLFFVIDRQLLSQYRPVLFNYNRDLSELLVICSGLPQYMIRHPWTFLLTDGIIFLLPLLLIGWYWRKGRFLPVIGGCFTVFLGLYLLLTNIFWEAHPEGYVQYFLLSLAFCTSEEGTFYKVLTGCRYYFLYIFVSAAFWKLARGAFLNPTEMSNILIVQHKDLLNGRCTALFCRAYVYLINHPLPGYCIYLGAILLEGVFAVGFFTRRWDRWLAVGALVFVLADLLLMRLTYMTILIGLVPLLLAPVSRKTPKAVDAVV